MSSGAFLRNLVLFGRALRGLGLDVNPGSMIDLVAALQFISIGQRSDFYYTARSLLVHRREDIARFDEAFEFFFKRRGNQPPLGRFQRVVGPLPTGEGGRRPGEGPSSREIIEATLTYSEREVLRKKDFAELTHHEIEEVRALMEEIVWHVRDRKTRRRRPGHGREADLRRTIRRNLRYGGEILDWAEREPKRKPRPLVIIADVSGSMERYTRLLLLFTYGVARALDQKVEAFVFSTRLTRITRELEQKSVDAALRQVSHAVQDWAGGTRIGEALRTFNFQWGRRVLGRGAVTMVISDGWDRGDVALLANEIARLQRSSRRLIWLNPLLGSPDYQPLTRGIQAALPFIDDFLPVHNLDNLESLAKYLEALGEYRPQRRQAANVRGRSEETA
jgi:uncharacterized protein with von Willebrand factor type A (vWA) domain